MTGTGTVVGPKARDDFVLPGHVVGGGQDMTERGSAQGEVPATSVGHPVREVRASTGDELEVKRWLGSVDVVGEPLSDPVDVHSLDGVVTGGG